MDFLTINGKIEVRTDEDEVLYGLIGDKDDQSFQFSLPGKQRNMKLFSVGENFRAIVYTNRKAVLFTATVAERLKEGIPAYKANDVRNIKVIQRRNNVRVPCCLDLKYTANNFVVDSYRKITNKEDIVETVDKYLTEATMIDISAGGIKFTCSEDLEEGRRILVSFAIEEDSILLLAEIRHKEITVYPSETKYYYGIRFEDVTEKLQEKLINHIFVLMRKQTRR